MSSLVRASMSTFRFAVAAACLIAVAACTSNREPVQAFEGDDMAGAAELRCDEADAVQPSPDAQVLADGVVVAGSFTAGDAGYPPGQMFAKGGLWVRGSTAVRLTLIKPSDSLMRWGKPGTRVRQVVAPPCDGTGWNVWPGGFYVSEPSTVTLQVETENGAVSVPIDVAAPRPAR